MTERGVDSTVFNESNEFLADNEPEIRRFLDILHAELDNCISRLEDDNGDSYNDGQLQIPLNADNLYAVQWETASPTLPSPFAEIAHIKKDDPVEITARYWYGKYLSMVNIWVSPKNGPLEGLSLVLRLRESAIETEVSSASGEGHNKSIRIDEQETFALMDAIFKHVPAYTSRPRNLTVTDAFQLGIAAQADIEGEHFTSEVGEKIFSAPSRMDDDVDIFSQFEFKVRIIDRTHPNSKPSKTIITLRRHFEPIDYDPASVYQGILEQSIEIDQDSNGTIVDIKRASSVAMYDEPFVVNVNGFEQVSSILNEAKKDVPEALAKKLYPSSIPTLEDLQYFERLATKPIAEEDVYI